LEVKVALCEAHLQIAGSKVQGNQTARSDILHKKRKTTLFMQSGFIYIIFISF